jgi:release factor glutamine methyltransferase
MNMRKILKSLASVFFVPLARWYLRKERRYTYQGTVISVLPGVFHPGMFSSTNFILDYLEKQDLTNQTLLEVGSGTGLISIMAAKAKAKATAIDISKIAIENTILNATSNHVELNIVHTDLFNNLEKHSFDWIIVNPPYYARDPKNERDLAWYCGENFEYFKKFFKGLRGVAHPRSHIIMVLTKDCDLHKIFSLGREEGFMFELLKEKDAFFDEKDFLYQIHSIASDKA